MTHSPLATCRCGAPLALYVTRSPLFNNDAEPWLLVERCSVENKPVRIDGIALVEDAVRFGSPFKNFLDDLLGDNPE